VERRGKEPLGRADLDLWLGDTEYFIEAKMCWLNLGDFLDADSIEKELGGRLVRASKDSRKYLFGPEDRWIAMVFVVPRIPKKLWRKPGEPERSLREFVRAVQSEHLGADMVAWTLPRGFKRWKRCIGDVDSAYFPAVALVGKRAPTRKAR
jgi:hypothetical protein